MNEKQQKTVGGIFVAAGIYAFWIANGDTLGYFLGLGTILVGFGIISWWKYIPGDH